ncbi:MAG TPA: anti-sigma F factor, partial [Firmicutes bacterium]|nr:anti-sigma F factor [Bacillota bacterium]
MKENYLLITFPSIPENVGLARVIVASFAAQLDFTL